MRIDIEDEYLLEQIGIILSNPKINDPKQKFTDLCVLLKPEPPLYPNFTAAYHSGITASELLRGLYPKPKAKPAKLTRKPESITPIRSIQSDQKHEFVVQAVKLRTLPIAPDTTSINKPGWLPDWHNADEYSHLNMQIGYSDEVGRLFRRKSAGHSDEVGHPLRGCAAG